MEGICAGVLRGGDCIGGVNPFVHEAKRDGSEFREETGLIKVQGGVKTLGKVSLKKTRFHGSDREEADRKGPWGKKKHLLLRKRL